MEVRHLSHQSVEASRLDRDDFFRDASWLLEKKYDLQRHTFPRMPCWLTEWRNSSSSRVKADLERSRCAFSFRSSSFLSTRSRLTAISSDPSKAQSKVLSCWRIIHRVTHTQALTRALACGWVGGRAAGRPAGRAYTHSLTRALLEKEEAQTEETAHLSHFGLAERFGTNFH